MNRTGSPIWQAALVSAACLVALIVWNAGRTQKVHRLPFRSEGGLFSNLVLGNMESAVCYPQHRLECTGWPEDVRALLPNLPRETDAASEPLPSAYIGSPCYFGQDAKLLASASFADVRRLLHPTVTRGGPFAPAEHVRARARAWWEREIGQRFVVGVHGRAPLHYEGDLDLETHVRLLADEAAEEARPGARVLLASCNRTIVEGMRGRFGASLAWREPEGELNTGNVDWGGAVQVMTKETATGALIDALLLSMCDVVVCGSSNLIVYAAALRPAMRIRIARHLSDRRGH
jgi:hypothetical protein